MIEDREIFRTVTIVDSFGREHRRIQRCAIEIRWTGGEPSSPPDATEVGEWMVLPVDSTPRFETLAKQFAHLVPRSDELCNIVMLCGQYAKGNCHGLTEKNWKMLPKLLAVKLEHDPLNTDFRRIAELRGRLFDFDTLA